MIFFLCLTDTSQRAQKIGGNILFQLKVLKFLHEHFLFLFLLHGFEYDQSGDCQILRRISFAITKHL